VSDHGDENRGRAVGVTRFSSYSGLKGHQYKQNGSTTDEDALLEQAELLEAGNDHIDGLTGVFHLLPAGDNQFPGAKEEGNDFRFIEAIHESGELLRFVFDILETETDGDCVQIEVAAEISAADDVLDDDLGVLFDLDLEFAKFVEDDVETLVDGVSAFRACTDDLP